ncbi:ATP-binding cassette domain-containing protein [Maritimibacter sp. DP07]|uniref:ATP-binding cassette domain-containing protein n=1 Tax=Maritimibacter harenae TaxID=2606218 RepID=A0A845M1S5_9RHOB|nr:ABC transporter ATP-binding protein [Maritimibacter harenae]MZR11473.1 ATP-binding cassette domain-containing protein [Maritimibacter harenae]
MSRLDVQSLTKSFGALKVTDDVSLTVEPGEIHAIIGPNGAGKTTLVAQLSGQLKPDSGRIRLDGADITGLSMPERVKRGLARSFQITSILPGFTVLENVALAVQARSGSSFRFFRPVAGDAALNDAAMEALTEAGLGDRAGVVASALSHGEHRRLELAIALATNPQVLLLDEPLAGVGGEDAEAFVARLRRFKGRFAMLLIEHDMDAVFALADRVSVLVYGRIIATGTPDEVRSDADVRAAYLGEEGEEMADA